MALALAHEARDLHPKIETRIKKKKSSKVSPQKLFYLFTPEAFFCSDVAPPARWLIKFLLFMTLQP